ncbi:flavodoxin family protein [Leucobacter sp. GX24907]
MRDQKLKALALNCTLKPSPAESSTQLMAELLLDGLRERGVDGNAIRVVDHNVLPGVEADMGEGDAWPKLRRRVLDADILVFVTPTWLGQPSSVAQRTLERLNAELSETDDEGRPILFDKVAVVGVVGNEDGAHHITAVLFQALNDIGYTVPAQGSVYWNGEAMHKTDFKDLAETPDTVKSSMETAATHAVHLAGSLRDGGYPSPR